MCVSITGSGQLETPAPQGQHDGDDDQPNLEDGVYSDVEEAGRTPNTDPAGVTEEWRLELGKDLPTAGSLTATIDPGVVDLPAGYGYHIEVRSLKNVNEFKPLL